MVKKSPEDVMHYTAILLEQMRDQIQIIAEGQIQLREDLSSRVEAVHHELKQESADRKASFRLLHGQMEKMNTRMDKMDEHMKDMEKRLSTKIDRLTDKVEQHDKEIAVIHTAFASRP
ncbi:MAG: hypothetical protein HY540_03495 [Deltaproteobacteria bacterium]|nr:hypothetical protein [Deltaproteobacteria bacterium]